MGCRWVRAERAGMRMVRCRREWGELLRRGFGLRGASRAWFSGFGEVMEKDVAGGDVTLKTFEGVGAVEVAFG